MLSLARPEELPSPVPLTPMSLISQDNLVGSQLYAGHWIFTTLQKLGYKENTAHEETRSDTRILSHSKMLLAKLSMVGLITKFTMIYICALLNNAPSNDQLDIQSLVVPWQ